MKNNNMPLNNQQINEEIRGNKKINEEIRGNKETNENENIMFQNPWDITKIVQKGKLIAIQAYLKKQEKSQIINLISKGARKRSPKLVEERIKIREEKMEQGLKNRKDK